MLVSIHLYRNAEHYASHHIFQELFESNQDIHSSAKSVFTMCVSDNAVAVIGDAGEECNLSVGVREEAIRNCCFGVHASMLCIIASADVLQRAIRSHYPDTGKDASRFSTVFNVCINPVPRSDVVQYPIIDILWSRAKGLDGDMNHFVPLFTVKGIDYSKETLQRRSKQANISNTFKTQLESANISTKKGQSVNFRMPGQNVTLLHFLPKMPKRRAGQQIPTSIQQNNTATTPATKIPTLSEKQMSILALSPQPLAPQVDLAITKSAIPVLAKRQNGSSPQSVISSTSLKCSSSSALMRPPVLCNLSQETNIPLPMQKYSSSTMINDPPLLNNSPGGTIPSTMPKYSSSTAVSPTPMLSNPSIAS